MAVVNAVAHVTEVDIGGYDGHHFVLLGWNSSLNIV